MNGLIVFGRRAPMTDLRVTRSGDKSSALVCWPAGSVAGTGYEALQDLHDRLLEGLSATGELLRSDRMASIDRVLLVSKAAGAIPLSTVLASTMGAFAKSLARELSRTSTTVNALGGGADASDESLVAASRYLLSDEAGFVTGQCLGTAGDRLGAPVPGLSGADVPSGWVLVSGGAGAIGEAITRRLHADGWKVIVGHVSDGPAQRLATELDPSGRTARTQRLDLTDLSAIPQCCDELAGSVGRLRGAVLCGGWNRTRPFKDTDREEWVRTLSINLTGPAMLAAELLRRTDGAPLSLAAIGSESGRIGDAGRAVYAAAKAGLARFMSRLAAEHRNVRAVTVAPGPVDTPLLRSTHGEDPAAAEQGIARLARLVPLGRLGRPKEIAGAVSFALSPGGASLNGEILSVGGGITMQ